MIDRETGIGAWNDSEIKRAITEGVRPDHGRLAGVPLAAVMPVNFYKAMLPRDLGAVVTWDGAIENAELQEKIYREHLLISPFAEGEAVHKSNFPARNRVMAALSDATAIIEASDTSGTLHQAAECARLNRWLFISQAIIDDPAIKWPSKFLRYERAVALNRVSDILDRIKR